MHRFTFRITILSILVFLLAVVAIIFLLMGNSNGASRTGREIHKEIFLYQLHFGNGPITEIIATPYASSAIFMNDGLEGISPCTRVLSVKYKCPVVTKKIIHKTISTVWFSSESAFRKAKLQYHSPLLVYLHGKLLYVRMYLPKQILVFHQVTANQSESAERELQNSVMQVDSHYCLVANRCKAMSLRH